MEEQAEAAERLRPGGASRLLSPGDRRTVEQVDQEAVGGEFRQREILAVRAEGCRVDDEVGGRIGGVVERDRLDLGVQAVERGGERSGARRLAEGDHDAGQAGARDRQGAGSSGPARAEQQCGLARGLEPRIVVEEPREPRGVGVVTDQPIPAKLEIYYSAPMVFEGNGSEEDEVVHGYVDQVKARIASLIETGRKRRRGEP